MHGGSSVAALGKKRDKKTPGSKINTAASRAQKTPVKKQARLSRRTISTQNTTRQRILAIATQEFSARGYDGARIDNIMRLSKVSKNLIYHYFGSKERLFVAVLETAYEGMHRHQTAWPLNVSSPIDGIRKLVRATFKYWSDSPEFIGLLNSENFHKGRHLRKSKLTKAGYAGLLGNVANQLKQGEKSGQFRSGVDPIDLYISISALAYHYLSNRYTLSYLFDRKFGGEPEMKKRMKHIEDMVLGYLQFDATRVK